MKKNERFNEIFRCKEFLRQATTNLTYHANEAVNCPEYCLILKSLIIIVVTVNKDKSSDFSLKIK